MTAGVTYSINASKRKREKVVSSNRLAVDNLCDKVEIFTSYSRARFEELYINTSNQTTTPVESKQADYFQRGTSGWSPRNHRHTVAFLLFLYFFVLLIP